MVMAGRLDVAIVEGIVGGVTQKSYTLLGLLSAHHLTKRWQIYSRASRRN